MLLGVLGVLFSTKEKFLHLGNDDDIVSTMKVVQMKTGEYSQGENFSHSKGTQTPRKFTCQQKDANKQYDTRLVMYHVRKRKEEEKRKERGTDRYLWQGLGDSALLSTTHITSVTLVVVSCKWCKAA